MTPPFSVSSTPHFDRLAKRLARGHPDFPAVYAEVLDIVHADPHNRSRKHHIKKLEGTRPGEGQWRLRLGRYRFRYDIEGRTVNLKRCSLRREDTYR